MKIEIYKLLSLAWHFSGLHWLSYGSWLWFSYRSFYWKREKKKKVNFFSCPTFNNIQWENSGVQNFLLYFFSEAGHRCLKNANIDDFVLSQFVAWDRWILDVDFLHALYNTPIPLPTCSLLIVY